MKKHTHTPPIHDESPVLPSVGIPSIKKYDMSLYVSVEIMSNVSRDTYIAMAEVQAERLAKAMVEKMVEDYDARNNPVRPDTVTS